MDKLRKLFEELAENPELEQAFRKNSRAVIDAADLSDEERALLRSGDVQKIQDAIGMRLMLPVIY